MRIVFLGTGGYHPNERRQTACVLLPELGIVFDAGTGFFRVPDRLMSPQLTVFLSHAHLDHICGLTYPLVALFTGKITQLSVYGTAQTLDAVKSHLFAEPVFPVPLDCTWHDLPEAVNIGPARITARPLRHPGGCTGFKVTCGDRSLAYITDTTASESYLDFIQGVDVLIHECNFADDMASWCEKTGHSHTSQVARLAKHANAGRLLLTHIDPQSPMDDPIGLATAQAIFPNTAIAEDLLEIEWKSADDEL
jgi:ribonuclease BN (tRNA processing enzyme)